MAKRKDSSGGLGFNSKASIGVVLLFAFVGCGGPSKPADAPGTCPEGTVLSGSDCVPAEVANTPHTSGESSTPSVPKDSPKAGGDADHASVQGVASGDAPAGSGTPYDRDAVEAELKRGARSVKANCGLATDENGQATGPWGRTKASVLLGRNGHVKQVSVPAPFDGKPVGLCIVHSFDTIQFPPYAASSDVTVDWDVAVQAPKK